MFNKTELTALVMAEESVRVEAIAHRAFSIYKKAHRNLSWLPKKWHRRILIGGDEYMFTATNKAPVTSGVKSKYTDRYYTVKNMETGQVTHYEEGEDESAPTNPSRGSREDRWVQPGVTVSTSWPTVGKSVMWANSAIGNGDFVYTDMEG